MPVDVGSALRAVAWFLATWLLVSAVAAVVITRLFRAQARRNDRIAADGRRLDWADAVAEEPGEQLAGR
jgi:hypothetical protein